MVARPQNRSVPDGFAEQCKTMGVLALRNHYRCRTETIWRWAKQLDVEPLQSRNRPKVTPPDDFAEHAARETAALMERYDCSAAVIHRWRKATGIAGPKIAPPRKPLRPMPAGFAAVAPTMGIDALTRHYGTNRACITRWLAEAGVQNKTTVSRVKPLGPTGINIAAGADASLAGQAAQHLRRIMPVFRASVIAKDRPGYVVGGRHMETEEMVALAAAKGFDPDAWRRVA